MKPILVLGAGKIGSSIADMLAATGDYRVTVADQDAGQLSRMDIRAPIRSLAIDIANPIALAEALKGQFAVLSAAPLSSDHHHRFRSQGGAGALPGPH